MGSKGNGKGDPTVSAPPTSSGAGADSDALGPSPEALRAVRDSLNSSQDGRIEAIEVVDPDEEGFPFDLSDLDADDDIIDVEVDGASTADAPEEPAPAKRKSRSTRRDLAVSGTRARLPESLSALNVYLARLKDVEILPIEEQSALAVKYQETGDREAAARLVASNLRLVVKIAFQFRRQWADVMDLVSEGNLGLSEAIRKFDASRGIPFPSYARYWIRARILAFIQENKHLIHAGSRAARKLFWRLERERRSLIADGHEPTAELLAERVGVKEKDVHELAPILDHRPVSLDVPVHGDEDGRTRGDILADPQSHSPEAAVGGGEIQQILEKTFGEFRATLDVRDQAIWDRRLQSEDKERLEDLGNDFGVSKERVRQLEARIKKKLKEFVQRKLGDDVIIQALN